MPSGLSHRTWLALGSNLGDRRALLCASLMRLRERGCVMESISPFIETNPEGFDSQHQFLNGAAVVRHDLEPEELLDLLQEIERSLGRIQKSHEGLHYDRTLDIDILMFDNLTLTTPSLIVPHPRMHERLFVLEPLSHIAPDIRHPLLGKTILELLSSCQTKR